MSSGRKQIQKKNINKAIANCASQVNIVPHKTDISSPYPTEKDYQNSFKDIEEFSKKITDTQKQSINVVVYNDSNADGMISAYTAYRYLYIDNKKTELTLVPIKQEHRPGKVHPYIPKFLDKMKNGNLIVVDIEFTKETFDLLLQHVKSIIVIDDHVDATKTNKTNKTSNSAKLRIYKTHSHAACAATWKFFYPSQPVPRFIQAIDVSDRKVFVPYLSNTDLFETAIGFKFAHNPSIGKAKKIELGSSGLMGELHNIVEENNVNFWIFMGKMFDDVQENFKYQVAKNFAVKQFQGYRVGVLNIGVPAIKKRVGRQILTNAKLHNIKIDFAVLYGFEYTSNESWQVTLIEEHTHQAPKYNLPALARKLGNTPRGGGGAKFVAQFLYKGNIFDLFK